jgi:tetratricopeptide (TPR) repeat protein
MAARRIAVAPARSFPAQLELTQALRPFKRPWLRGRRLQLDIDATVRSYGRTWHLVPVFRPAPERWFDVAFLVDDSPSMALWAPEASGLAHAFAQAGMFRTVRRFSFSPGEADQASSQPPSMRTSAGGAVSPRQLLIPGGRRLIVIVTDGAAAGWRQAPAWNLVRSWAVATPTVVISPLAARLWGYTGLDQPAVRVRPGPPGSPSPRLRYSAPLYLQEPGQPPRAWLPVPALTLSPARLGQWARALMRGDPAGCDALLVPLTGEAAGADDDEAPSAASGRTFLRLASARAARLAGLCALLPEVSLPLLRLLGQEIVRGASSGDLAEVIMSGLFELAEDAAGDTAWRLRDGTRRALLEGVTESDAWQVYDMLIRHITRQSGPRVAALVPDRRGEVELPVELVPYAEAARAVLDLLDGSAGDEPQTPAEPEAGGRNEGGEAPAKPRPSGGSTVVGNIPRVPPVFQPRADLLDRLTAAGPGATAIVGPRGSGKTQLAAEYARSRVRYDWRLVAWVNAEDEASLLAGLAEVADRLGLPASATVEEAAGRARDWLEADGARCLIVFDNVTDVALLRPYLPRAGNAKLLVTSSVRPDPGPPWKTVPMGVFTEGEATLFLAGRTGMADAEGAARLARELGYLPLALALAGAQIARDRITYQAYLDRYQGFQGRPFASPLTFEAPSRALVKALQLALDNLAREDKGSLGARIMEALSLLSDAGVTRDLLLAVVEAGLHAQSADMDRALVQLAERSLLSFSGDGQAIIVHRLVMRVIRTTLSAGGELARAVNVVVAGLIRQARTLPGSAGRASLRAIPEQVSALLGHVGDTYKADQDLSERLLNLRSWALYCLGELGDSWSQAVTVGESLAADVERAFGPEGPQTLVVLSNLARAYRARGETGRSIDLHSRVAAVRERTLGADDPATLLSQANLASVYQEAGRTQEAIALYERALSGLEQAYGLDHPHALATRNNLAVSYQDAGRVSEAIPLLERTLAAQEQYIGPDHPQTLNSRGNLARAYGAAGDPERALPLLQRAWHDREERLGPDHPDTLAALNNVAEALTGLGRLAEALPLLERAVAARESLLGPQHPDTLSSRNNLAIAYQAAGRVAEAIPVFERVLDDRLRVLGPDHPLTLASMNNLGSAYQEAGRWGDALRSYERAFNEMRRVLGPGHPDTRLAGDNLAYARARGG